MIDDLKEDSNKWINEIRKSGQDKDKKFSNKDEELHKEIEILEKNPEMLEIKSLIKEKTQ
jgi:hypothetical protein